MKDSQKVMMQHSEIKIQLLKLYLERYLNILANSKYVGQVYIYDLFCGEGIYENGGEGSPIIILQTIKDVHNGFQLSGKQLTKFVCRFNDLDQSKIDKLQSIVGDKRLTPASVDVMFSSIDYREILNTVSNEIKFFRKEKAFIFIDPYGYKDIRVSDIQQLLKSGTSEVLLFLPTQFMFRFESKGTPESLKEFINELMPINRWPSSETGIEFIQNLTEAFRNALGKNYFVDSFIITRDRNQFFCLFFFTSHIYGFEKMLESKWKIDEEEGRGWSYEAENSLFSQSEKSANTYKLEEKLLNYLHTKRTNAELYEFTLHNGNLPTHANEILLKYQHKLLSLKNDGTKARKSAFYLNYTAYRDEPCKITVQLK
jgi:three-Cys-motif partner protein